MKVFSSFNSITACPVCGKNTDKASVLIPVPKTADGDVCEGIQIHVACIDLQAIRNSDGSVIIFQITGYKLSDDRNKRIPVNKPVSGQQGPE